MLDWAREQAENKTCIYFVTLSPKNTSSLSRWGWPCCHCDRERDGLWRCVVSQVTSLGSLWPCNRAPTGVRLHTCTCHIDYSQSCDGAVTWNWLMCKSKQIVSKVRLRSGHPQVIWTSSTEGEVHCFIISNSQNEALVKLLAVPCKCMRENIFALCDVGLKEQILYWAALRITSQNERQNLYHITFDSKITLKPLAGASTCFHGSTHICAMRNRSVLFFSRGVG